VGTFVRSCVLLIAFLGFNSVASGAELEHEDMKGRWGLGVNFGDAFPLDDDGGSGFHTEGRIIYGIMDQVALGFETGFLDFDYKIEDTDFGALEGVPFFATVQWRHPFIVRDRKATLYLVSGLGAISWRFDESDGVRRLNEQIEAGTAFGAKGAVGVDFFLGEKWAINVEWSFVNSTTKVEFKVPGIRAQETVDTDYWVLGGGVKYLI